MEKRKIPQKLLDAHQASSQNKELVKKSKMCGCFFCGSVFPAAEVEIWAVGQKDKTAICPYCFVDAVIPDAAGFELDKAFLTKMHQYWFGV